MRKKGSTNRAPATVLLIVILMGVGATSAAAFAWWGRLAASIISNVSARSIVAYLENNATDILLTLGVDENSELMRHVRQMWGPEGPGCDAESCPYCHTASSALLSGSGYSAPTYGGSGGVYSYCIWNRTQYSVNYSWKTKSGNWDTFTSSEGRVAVHWSDLESEFQISYDKNFTDSVHNQLYDLSGDWGPSPSSIGIPTAEYCRLYSREYSFRRNGDIVDLHTN